MAEEQNPNSNPYRNGRAEVNLEMCMSGLDREKAAVFMKRSGRMTEMSRINEIMPSHEIRVRAVRVFNECDRGCSLLYRARHPRGGVQLRQLRGNGPNSLRAAGDVSGRMSSVWPSLAWEVVWRRRRTSGLWAARVKGYTCRSRVAQPLPGGGCVAYWCFTTEGEFATRCWK